MLPFDHYNFVCLSRSAVAGTEKELLRFDSDRSSFRVWIFICTQLLLTVWRSTNISIVSRSAGFLGEHSVVDFRSITSGSINGSNSNREAGVATGG